MQLEDYFDFIAPDDIRIKGHRLGIESVLYEFIYRGLSAKEIAERFPSLTLEQVHATVLYYLHNQAALDAYMAGWLESSRRCRQEQARDASPFLARIRKLRTERRAAAPLAI